MSAFARIAAVCALAFALASAAPAGAQTDRPTSSYDRGPDGTWAYGKWLSEIGYRPVRIDRYTAASPFEIPNGTRALLLLSPAYPIPAGDAERILAFVRDGGLLVYAARGVASALDDGFGLIPGAINGSSWPQRVAADTLGVPRDVSVNCTAEGSLGEVYSGKITEHQALLTADGTPTTISFRYGSGRVIATTSPCMFTNRSLADDAAARIARAFLKQVPSGSSIAFDEFHHFPNPGAFVLDLDDFTPGGRRVTRGNSDFSISFGNLPLASSAWGTALLIGLLTCVVWLVLSGRRLGRAIPLPAEIRPRSAADFALAMAQLHERGRDTQGLRAHLRRKLKRAIGLPLGIEQDAPDVDFVAAVARARSDIDSGRLAQTLAALNRERTTGAELLPLSADVNQLIQRYR